MIELLKDIVCLLEKMAAAIIGLLVVVLNAAIAAIGLLVGGLVSLLPGFPEAPEIPQGGVLGVINWFVPIGPDLALIALILAMWVAFIAFWFALKYFKAL